MADDRIEPGVMILGADDRARLVALRAYKRSVGRVMDALRRGVPDAEFHGLLAEVGAAKDLYMGSMGLS